MHFDETSGGEGMGLLGDDEEAARSSDKPPSPVVQHDPWLTSRAGTPLASLAADIWQSLEEETRGTATRQPRQDAAERRKAIVQNLLANLVLLAFRHPPGHRLAVSADKQATSRYDRKDLPREPLVATLRALEAAGLVIRYPGVSRQLRTTIEPADILLALFADVEATLEHIDRAPGAETIILKADVGRRRPKVLIDYRDCPEADRLRAEMADINAALNQADIRLDGERQPPVHLVRIFQVDGPKSPESFHRFGRVFHGFWQGLKRDRRAGLTIKGEPLVELDYKAVFVHLAYAAQGAASPQGDPYSVPGLEAHREGVKKALAALFFRWGPMRRLSGELRELLPVGWTAKRLTETLAAHHPAIAPLFGTGVGRDLMFTESRVIVAVLRRLLAEGIAALPIHDCLLAPVSKRGDALAAMLEVSAKIVGIALPVEEKAERSDQITRC